MQDSIHIPMVTLPHAQSTSRLRVGVSALAVVSAMLFTAPAFAQDAAEENASEIVVTGFRASLESAQARKQDADTIIDSVTAEDIGALPDRSVTETLQRIPGISINRFAAGVDPDHFSVEGSGVTIRGLSYVGSRFNGRNAFSAGNGSGLSFADVPSELLGGVDVYKTPSANLVEGGIGGIVDLRTRKPLDQDGQVIAASLEMNYGDFAKKGSPTASFLVSDRWSTGIGEFGLLASVSYSQLFSRADRLGISGFRPRQLFRREAANGNPEIINTVPGGENDGFVPITRPGPIVNGQETRIPVTGLFPRGAVLGRQEFNRERYGYSAAAQWRSNDGTMEATAQFLRSDARQTWGENTIEIATDNVAGNGDSRAVAGTSLTFGADGLFESGLITGPTGWRDDQNGADPRTPVIGLQSNNIAREHYERIKTDDFSFNLRWTPSDNLALNFDYQRVNSRSEVIDNGLWISTYQDANITLNGNDLPSVSFVPPQTCETLPCAAVPNANNPSYYSGNNQSYTDPYNSFYRSAMDHVEDSEGSEDAFRLDAELSFPDSGFLKSVTVGGRYSQIDQTARFSLYNWGALSEQWGNGGPVWLDDNVDGVQGGNGGAPLPRYEEVYFDDFFRGNATNPIAGQGRLFYSGRPVRNLAQYQNDANAITRDFQGYRQCNEDGRTVNAQWNQLDQRCGVIPGTNYLPGEVNPQQTENIAAYAMAKFDTELGGARLTGNFGVRYTRTERASQGFFQITNDPAQVQTEAQCTAAAAQPGLVPEFCELSEQQRADARLFLGGRLDARDNVNTYDYFLPSFNAKLDLGGGLQFRAGYFKGVSAPQFGFSRNYAIVSGLSAIRDVDAAGNAIPGTARIQGTLNAGNPELVPTTADNFDLTAEYYFGGLGQITASLFHKRLYNVVTNSATRIEITNNGVTYPVVFSQPVNSDDVGKLTGAEISYQQVFDFLPGPLSGLGLQATYTYVTSTGVPQTTLSATDPDVAAGNQPSISGENFPLQGLSKHTVNITPFIDIGPLSMRASYNWRSRYLLTIRDVIVPFDPIFQRSYGQLDASITLTVNENFKIGLQGVNLTNSTTQTEAAVLDGAGDIRYVPRQWYVNDSRYTLLVRLTF